MTLMSRQRLGVVAVGTSATTMGFTGSVTSMMEVPSLRPNKTNSRPSEVHPQQSLPLPGALPPVSSNERTHIKSSPRQGYCPAIPSSQGTWAWTDMELTHSTHSSAQRTRRPGEWSPVGCTPFERLEGDVLIVLDVL